MTRSIYHPHHTPTPLPSYTFYLHTQLPNALPTLPLCHACLLPVLSNVGMATSCGTGQWPVNTSVDIAERLPLVGSAACLRAHATSPFT